MKRPLPTTVESAKSEARGSQGGEARLRKEQEPARHRLIQVSADIRRLSKRGAPHPGQRRADLMGTDELKLGETSMASLPRSQEVADALL